MSIFEIPTPQQSIGFQFWKLHKKWQKQVSAILTPHNITHTQFIMLASIAWFEEQQTSPSQTQVCKLMNLGKMTFSKAIRQLESTHLIHRKQSNVDARSVSLSLTREAMDIMPQLMHVIESIDKQIFGSLNTHEKQQFNQMLLSLNNKG